MRPAGSTPYDVHIDEVQQSAVNFEASDGPNNKPVVLFTDTAEDGAAMGALWESQAPKFGYTIAYRAQFPTEPRTSASSSSRPRTPTRTS